MKRYTTSSLITLFTVSLVWAFGASAPNEHSENASPESSCELFDQVLDAHGGFEQWRRYQRMDYAIPDFPLGEKAPMKFQHTADIKNRRHFMVGDNYHLGFDGEKAWGVNADAAGLPPRFVTKGNFYFVAMPFVFADPGVHVRSLGRRTLDGVEYETLGVEYADSVGDTTDDYVLFVDPNTKRLHLAHFTVTYGTDRGNTPIDQIPRTALVFNEWQIVDGLVIPAKATFYTWKNGSLEGPGTSFVVNEASFKVKPPSEDLFSKPQDAGVDLSHLST